MKNVNRITVTPNRIDVRKWTKRILSTKSNNILQGWGTRSLKKEIRNGYEEYTGIKGARLYASAWPLILQDKQSLDKHSRGGGADVSADHHLCATFFVKSPANFHIYFQGTPVYNAPGSLVCYSPIIEQWSDIVIDQRISVEVDIYSDEFILNNPPPAEIKERYVRI